MGREIVEDLQSQIEELKTRLAETEQLIEAIRTGEVDAFAINNGDGREVYTLQSGDYAYRVLVEKFGEGALNLSEEGLIVYCNEAFCDLLDLSYEKVIGSYIFDYIAEDSQELFGKYFEHAVHNPIKGEINLKAGKHIASVYISLTSLQPHLATIGMIVTDLTEKKTNEKIITGFEVELEQKNRLLLNKNKQLERQILEEFSESFSEYKSGKDFFNSLTCSLAEKTGMDYTFIAELATDGNNDFIIKVISSTAFGKLNEHFETQLHNDPAEKVIREKEFTFPENCRTIFPESNLIRKLKVEGYSGYPLYDQNKDVIGVIAVMHQKKIQDISYVESLIRIAARRAEMEMERIRNEKMMVIKNTELQNQNVELASFSYIASHDLQEPLRKIQAFTSRIQDKEIDKLSELGQDYFARIKDSAARMQNLIEALLVYSRTNTNDIALETTDLNAILRDVQSDLQEDIREHNVHIESDTLPELQVVSLQIHQLFSNILSNAIKYRKSGISPIIKITSSIVPATDIKAAGNYSKSRYWKISIADNGIGFESQHETKVFELFQRLHGKSEYAGTGIGLAICKKIMQNHQGAITADGIPGIGATFHIYLPYS